MVSSQVLIVKTLLVSIDLLIKFAEMSSRITVHLFWLFPSWLSLHFHYHFKYVFNFCLYGHFRQYTFIHVTLYKKMNDFIVASTWLMSATVYTFELPQIFSELLSYLFWVSFYHTITPLSFIYSFYCSWSSYYLGREIQEGKRNGKIFLNESHNFIITCPYTVFFLENYFKMKTERSFNHPSIYLSIYFLSLLQFLHTKYTVGYISFCLYANYPW